MQLPFPTNDANVDALLLFLHAKVVIYVCKYVTKASGGRSDDAFREAQKRVLRAMIRLRRKELANQPIAGLNTAKYRATMSLLTSAWNGFCTFHAHRCL